MRLLITVDITFLPSTIDRVLSAPTIVLAPVKVCVIKLVFIIYERTTKHRRWDPITIQKNLH